MKTVDVGTAQPFAWSTPCSGGWRTYVDIDNTVAITSISWQALAIVPMDLITRSAPISAAWKKYLEKNHPVTSSKAVVLTSKVDKRRSNVMKIEVTGEKCCGGEIGKIKWKEKGKTSSSSAREMEIPPTSQPMEIPPTSQPRLSVRLIWFQRLIMYKLDDAQWPNSVETCCCCCCCWQWSCFDVLLGYGTDVIKNGVRCIGESSTQASATLDRNWRQIYIFRYWIRA